MTLSLMKWNLLVLQAQLKDMYLILVQMNLMVKNFNPGLKTFPHESQNFEAVFKLGNLGFRFFNDTNFPIYKGGFEITFPINNDNNIILSWIILKADGTEDTENLPAEGKVIIETLYLRVPIIECSSEAKINIIGELFKEIYILQFKKNVNALSI